LLWKSLKFLSQNFIFLQIIWLNHALWSLFYWYSYNILLSCLIILFTRYIIILNLVALIFNCVFFKTLILIFIFLANFKCRIDLNLLYFFWHIVNLKYRILILLFIILTLSWLIIISIDHQAFIFLEYKSLKLLILTWFRLLGCVHMWWLLVVL
jgi:hypothetical protein